MCHFWEVLLRYKQQGMLNPVENVFPLLSIRSHITRNNSYRLNPKKPFDLLGES